VTSLLAFAFVAGTVATANPCGFALLPAYLAQQLHPDKSSPQASAALMRALLVGAITTAGFLLVFGTIGGAITLGARLLVDLLPWASLAIGAALMVAGIAVLAGKRIGVRLPTLGSAGGQRGYASVFMFGLGYGTASLSCTLPIFLAVLGTAATADPLTGVLSFAAYAAGMGTVLTALAIAAAVSSTGLANATRRVLPHMARISGLFLIAAGGYVVLYWSAALWPESIAATWATPVAGIEHLAASIQVWIQQPVVQTSTYLAAAILTGLGGWAIWRAIASPKRDGDPERAVNTTPETEHESVDQMDT
jgi:cytochrome c-type biogenesis protein